MSDGELKAGNKRLFIVIGVILLVVVVGAVVLLKSAAPEPAKDGQQGSQKTLTRCSLRLKWILVSGFAGELAAKDQGYFEEEGLDVTILPGGFENKPEKLVAAGSDTFGITGADGVLLARQQGVPIVAFAAQYSRNATAFFSLKSSGITKPQQFAGKKVGVKYGLEMDPIYRALLKKTGVDASGITEVPMSYSIAPLLEGQVDVFPSYMNSIFPAATKKGAEVNVIDPNDYGVRFHGNVYFCTEETYKNKPELVSAFARAVIKGWQWAAENPAKVGELVKKFNTEADPEAEVEAFRVVLPYLKPANGKIGWLNRTVVEGTKAILMDAGSLKKDVPIDEAFTWDILNQIYK